MKGLILVFFLLLSVAGFSQDSVEAITPAIPSAPKKTIGPQPIATVKNNRDSVKNFQSNKPAGDSNNGANLTTDATKAIADSTKRADSAVLLKKDTGIYKLLQAYPLLSNNTPETMITHFRNSDNKDYLFYLLSGIVFLMALTRIIFPRYFKNVFNIFFQTSFRQNQTKEQLTQENIASLLLNVLFIASAATFVSLVATKFNIVQVLFWKVFISSCIALIAIYSLKLLFTNFMGWIFNCKDAAEMYNFTVFVINKIIGVALVPLLFLFTFSTKYIQQLAFTTAVMFIGVLFLYRFFSIYKNLTGRLKISAIHFFLYFCGVEILPLLIIYKALSNYVSNGI